VRRNVACRNKKSRERLSSRWIAKRNGVTVAEQHTRQKIGAGMSSSKFREPGFRLIFGIPDIVLTRDGAEPPILTMSAEAPGLIRDLRHCAALVAAAGGARLTVVLPAGEVWRGLPVLPGRTPFGRRQAAWRRAAAELDARPDAVAVRCGRRLAEGATPVAAVRTATLAETRRLLERAGLRPDAIVGAGLFPGFAAPPAFALPWRPGALPFAAGLRRPVALGAIGTAAIGLALALPSLPADPPATPISAGAEAAPPEAVAVLPPAPQPQPAAPAAAAPVETAAAILAVRPPRSRPGPVAPPQGRVTVASRNLPFPVTEARPAAAGVKVVELTSARARPADLVAAPPQHRPGPRATLSDAEPAPVPTLRPARRPDRPEAQTAAVASPAKAAAGASARPMPRPGADMAPLVVAALTPAAAALPARSRVDTPPSRPAVVAAPAVSRKSPVVVAPKPVTVAPQVVRAAAPRPAAVPAVRVVSLAQPKAAPRTEIVRVAAPVAKKPIGVRAPAPAAKQAAARPVAQKATVRQTAQAQRTAARRMEATGARRVNLSNVALIGVFGGESGRHALVRMPNGRVERVRPGDSVQGLRVASVGADSVSLRNGARETTLRLPD
jgi:hypothetical protein